jgi:hypothetical protein
MGKNSPNLVTLPSAKEHFSHNPQFCVLGSKKKFFCLNFGAPNQSEYLKKS